MLPLAGDVPLIRETRERLDGLVDPERVHLLAGAALGVQLLGALPDLDRDNLLAEPAARGTGPVLAWAAHALERLDPGAVMISLHADHMIQPADMFRRQLAEVAGLAHEHGRLFTIGVPPTRPETGYGYIRVGESFASGEAYAVDRFVEKPDAATARSYLDSGDHLWNTGIFVWPAALFLEEIREHTPEIAPHLSLLDAGRTEAFFDAVTPVTVDVGVMERSRRVAVSPARFAWDDVGSWEALGRTRTPDGRGNVGVGRAALIDSDGTIAWAEEGRVVTWGVRDLVVVHRPGVTLVMPRERASRLKDLLGALPEDIRDVDATEEERGEHG